MRASWPPARTFNAAVEAAEHLSAEGVEVSVWDPRILKPLDRTMVLDASAHPLVVTVEDGVRVGGFGSLLSDALQQLDVPTVPRIAQLGTPGRLPFPTALRKNCTPSSASTQGHSGRSNHDPRPHHRLATESARGVRGWGCPRAVRSAKSHPPCNGRRCACPSMGAPTPSHPGHKRRQRRETARSKRPGPSSVELSCAAAMLRASGAASPARNRRPRRSSPPPRAVRPGCG